MLLPFLVGRLPSPRWRPVAWTVGVAGGLTLIGAACRPALLDVAFLVEDAEVTAQLTNPLGVAALGQLFEPFLLVLLLGEAVGAAALLLRFRRSRGIERQQLKWIAYAALLFGIQQGGLALARLAGVVPDTEMAWPEVVDTFTFVFSFVAIAVAVLRYRLYEIDRLINRTLVYVLVTVLLGAVYTAGVFGLGRLLNPVTGQATLAVAASTLAVTALFQPVRRRIQAAVDRRFNRRRYDAAKTVEAFSAPGSATKSTWTLFPLPLQVRAMCSA
jgi:predicted membrane protein